MSLKQAEEELILEAFEALDRDKDGCLSYYDIHQVVVALKIPSVDPQDVINRVDMNGTGMVTFEDFLSYMVQKMKMEEEDKTEYKQVFAIWSQNGAYITENRIIKVFLKFGVRVSLQEAKSIIEENDHDKDGKISLSDFMTAMSDK